MHLLFGLTRRATSVLMQGLIAIVLIGSTTPSALLDHISIDLLTIFRKYHLDPVIHSYVCCPRCFALYDPDSAPPQCTFRAFDDKPRCRARLFKTRTIRGRDHTKPIRLYLHQNFREWLGRLLSRPDIEEFLGRPPPAMMTKFMEDIWHGSVFMKDFLGPDGKKFQVQEDGSLRLVFGLAVDGFNSYRNIQAKKKATSTGIYMVCYNLPPDLRYLPENMYLAGIIPGKPSLDQINHSLALLVKDLKPFWSPGVRYTRTANCSEGRHVNAALVPLISDLPAGRQVGGFGAVKHRLFCIGCLLNIDDIENFDPSSWPCRTLEFHLKGVKAWTEARDSKSREEVVKMYGARWSALLELPYWNALDFTVIDSMDNHYLGLLQTHLRSIWGMNLKAEDGDGFSHPQKDAPPFPKPELLQRGTTLLTSGRRDELLKIDHHVIWHLCAQRSLRRTKNKKMMVTNLLKWVGFPHLSHNNSDVGLA